jgi:hypothetical protein
MPSRHIGKAVDRAVQGIAEDGDATREQAGGGTAEPGAGRRATAEHAQRHDKWRQRKQDERENAVERGTEGRAGSNGAGEEAERDQVLGLLLALTGILILSGPGKRPEASLVTASPDWLASLTTRF